MDGIDGDDAAFAERGERGDDDVAAGRKGDGAVEGDGWAFGFVADPRCAQSAGESPMGFATARDVDFAIPGLEDFDGEVRRGSEAEEADAISGRGFGDAQAAETDDARAEEWGEVKGIGSFGERDEEVGAGDGVFGIAAIDGVAGVGGVVAEVLAVFAAEGAGAVGSAEPRDAGAVADLNRTDVGAEFFDAPDDLVARCDGVAQRRQFSQGDVEVGAADAAGFDFEEDLAGAGLGDGQVFDAQRVRGDGSGMVEDSGANRVF